MSNPEGGLPEAGEKALGNEALRDAVVQLRKSLEQIDERLARLERLQPASAAPQPPPLPSPLLTVTISAEPASPLPDIPLDIPPLTQIDAPAEIPEPPSMAARATEENPPHHFETRMGLTLVNRIGVVTLIIGVAFFFKYAIDNQWIGEMGRVALGVLAGLITLGAGDVLWRRGQKIFAQGICGLGIAILYLAFYASFSFYRLLPQAAAFGLMVMVTALAGALALRYGSMAIAALGMLGGYATPLLLSTGQDAPWTFFSYIFLIDLGALSIARVRRWRPLELLAFLATVILTLAWYGEWFRHEKQLVATCAALAFFLLFAFVESAPLFYFMQAFAAIIIANTWPEPTPYLLISLSLGAAGLVIADLKRRPRAAAVSFAAFWGAYGFWRAMQPTPNESTPLFLLLTIAFVLYALWPLFQILVRRTELRAELFIVMALNGAVYYAASYIWLEPHHHAWMGLLAVAVAAVHLLLGAVLYKKHVDTRLVMLHLGLALAFLTLAVPIQFTGFTVTMSWAMEAAALMWISRRMKNDRLSLGALAVYAFVFLRLYTLDISALPAPHALLVNTRFLTFLVSAACFWLGAWSIRSRQTLAAALYVMGHVVMFSACLLEFDDWAGSVGIENRASVMAMGVSILMALYAVMLVSIGVVYRSVLDRIMGLVLIGMVVLKLYLYDVWEASKLFRTAAFVALGALLLLTSYLYSHFRPSIESLWRDKNESLWAVNKNDDQAHP